MKRILISFAIFLSPLMLFAQHSSFGGQNSRTSDSKTTQKDSSKDNKKKDNRQNDGKKAVVDNFRGEEFMNVYVRHAGQLSRLVGRNRDFVRHLNIRGVLDYSDIDFLQKLGSRLTCYRGDKSRTWDSFLEINLRHAVLEPSTRLDFSYSSHLRRIDLPENTVRIDRRAFYGCHDLRHVYIPRGVEYIDESAFEDCYNLENVMLPERMVAIGAKAFKNCRLFTRFFFPYGIERIDNEVLSGTRLSEISIPNGVTSIGSLPFYDTGIQQIFVPASVNSVALDAFAGISSLTTLNVDANNGSYESDGQVLYDKEGTRVLFVVRSYAGLFNVPEGFEVIETDALNGCKNVNEVVLPSTLTAIGHHAFAHTGISEIEIPESVTEIGDCAFAGTRLKSFCLPYTVASVGSGLLQESLVDSVDLPDNLTKIGEEMFYNCKQLKYVHIPEAVTTIAKKAFYGCSLLSNVTLPKGLLSIGDRAFNKCNSMTEFVIPSDKVKLENKVLYDCDGLQSVYAPYMTPEKNDNICDNKNTVLYVPKGTASLYKKQKGWKKFKKITEK